MKLKGALLKRIQAIAEDKGIERKGFYLFRIASMKSFKVHTGFIFTWVAI